MAVDIDEDKFLEIGVLEKDFSWLTRMLHTQIGPTCTTQLAVWEEHKSLITNDLDTSFDTMKCRSDDDSLE